MALIDVLSSDRILVDPTTSSKQALLAELVALVVGDSACAINCDAETLLKVVLDRENQLSTGLQEGIAVPHGMINEEIATVGALAIVPSGLEFDCMDDCPAMFITLLVFSNTPDGRSQHVALLAETVGLFTNPDVRSALLSCQSTAEAWGHLENATL